MSQTQSDYLFSLTISGSVSFVPAQCPHKTQALLELGRSGAVRAPQAQKIDHPFSRNALLSYLDNQLVTTLYFIAGNIGVLGFVMTSDRRPPSWRKRQHKIIFVLS